MPRTHRATRRAAVTGRRHDRDAQRRGRRAKLRVARVHHPHVATRDGAAPSRIAGGGVALGPPAGQRRRKFMNTAATLDHLQGRCTRFSDHPPEADGRPRRRGARGAHVVPGRPAPQVVSPDRGAVVGGGRCCRCGRRVRRRRWRCSHHRPVHAVPRTPRRDGEIVSGGEGGGALGLGDGEGLLGDGRSALAHRLDQSELAQLGSRGLGHRPATRSSTGRQPPGGARGDRHLDALRAPRLRPATCVGAGPGPLAPHVSGPCAETDHPVTDPISVVEAPVAS